MIIGYTKGMARLHYDPVKQPLSSEPLSSAARGAKAPAGSLGPAERSPTARSTAPAWAEELQAAGEAARAAGDIIAGLYRGDYTVREKSRGNPVTTADLGANRAIREILAARFSGDAWLSEEDADDPRRLDRGRVWIVDPLDGTREFIRGIPEFCVSIGLAVDGVPVLGVICHPLRGELFSAVRGGGAHLNGEPLRVSRPENAERPRLLISRAEPRKRLAELEREFALEPMGSIAYRLAAVAHGRADATLTFRRVKEWDVCAGVVIVEEAGGRTMTGCGERPVFNQRQPVLQQLVAGSEAINARIHKLVVRLPD